MSTAVTSETAPAIRRGGSWRPPLLSCVAIVLAVVLANAAFVFGWLSNDPMLYSSGLGSSTGAVVGGYYTIDPNNGWTAQALGRLAAETWAHGHLPLWNPYEGLGQPLVGEMQSAAFFQPFIMLQLLPSGIFVMHLALEIIAGLSTLFFLRRLRLGWVASAVGGCLFALTGAFSVMQNAPFNPIAFLPLGLLGVEMIFSPGRMSREKRSAAQRASDRSDTPSPDDQTIPENQGRPSTSASHPWAGFATLGLAIGWMLLAGFPETAFLEGLFVGCWALMRLVQARGRRGRFAAWTFGGVALGLALAAPALVSFVDFLSWASTAYHDDASNSTGFSADSTVARALPYAVGALGNPVMRLQAGYLTLPGVLLALVGLFSTGRRSTRALLGAIILALLGSALGFPPLRWVLDHTPGLKAILVYKYGLSLLEFAVVVAAAIGLDDLARGRVTVRRTLVSTGLVAVYTAGSVWYLVAHDAFIDPVWSWWYFGLVTLACLLVVVALLAARHRRAGTGTGAASTDSDTDIAVNRGTTDGENAQTGSTLAGDRAARTGRTAAYAPNKRSTAALAAAALALVLTAIGHYSVPQTGAHEPGPIDTEPVHYLKTHLGTSRFYTLGPIQPDYGSYWGLAQLNANDLPVPEKYGEFVMNELRPTASGISERELDRAFKDYQLVPFNPGVAVQKQLLVGYGERQQAFRDAGVRYVVTRPNVVDAESASRLGLVKVLSAYKADIFEDAKATPYYTSDGACHVVKSSRADVTLDCARAATLTRRELNAPGWSATINGASHPVAVRAGQLYQQVEVPRGRSRVRFVYRPKHFTVAAGASALGLGLLMFCGAADMMGRRRARRSRPSMTDRPAVSGATAA